MGKTQKGLGSKGLGRGLSALIAQSPVEKTSSDNILEIDIKKIYPNENQPRKYFKAPEIEELAASIKEFGIIQPLVVKKTGDKYIIVAGERRFRAATQAGLKNLPVILREYSDLEILGIALIENIQREDLNPIEEANCYKRLADEFGMTQGEIAKKIGKSRSHISNCMRVLKLDDTILDLISSEKISMGHAKAILAVECPDFQLELANRVVDEGLNVRQTEELSRTKPTSQAKKAAKPLKKTYDHFTKDFGSFFGTKVAIKDNKKGGGKIEINYSSTADLERIMDIIKK